MIKYNIERAMIISASKGDNSATVMLNLAIRFAVVGALGLGAQVILLQFILRSTSLDFLWGNAISVVIATCLIYSINNRLYKEQRLREKEMLKGLIRFLSFSSGGISLNVCSAWLIFATTNSSILAQATGIIVGYIFTMTITRRATWQ